MAGVMLSYDQLTMLIRAANENADCEPFEDGTFTVEAFGGYVYVTRVQGVKVGYEVGYHAMMPQGVHNPRTFVQDRARFGVWTDPDTGIVHIDDTIHVTGPREVAARIAESFGQKSFWGWAERDCFTAERV